MSNDQIPYEDWKTAIDAARETTQRNFTLTEEQIDFLRYARTPDKNNNVVSWPILSRIFNEQFGTSHAHRKLNYKYAKQIENA